MLRKLFPFSAVMFFIFSACQKDVVSKPAPADDASSSVSKLSEASSLNGGVIDTSKGWYGGYSGYFGPYPLVPASELIKDGVARDPYYSGTFSYTNYTYDIPFGYNISGDSLIFEATVKNPKDGSYYEPDNDIVLQMNGDKDTAELHFVADASFQSYTQYHIGKAFYSNLPQLINYFDDFKTVRWVLRNNSTAAFVNKKYVYGFNYGTANKMGKLLEINIAGKGYGTVDNVRLLNSYTGKLILSEDFNTDGKSNTILY